MMNRIKQAFAAKMALIRDNQSFRDFSESILNKTGVSISHSTLHDYENTGNDIMPRAENLEALAKYAGVKPSWLLDEEEYEKPDELLKKGLILAASEDTKREYITDEFAVEVARMLAKDGSALNKDEKVFLLNMIKTYIASVGNNKQKQE